MKNLNSLSSAGLFANPSKNVSQSNTMTIFRILVLIVIVFIYCIPGRTQPQTWQWLNPIPTGNSLYSVTFTNQDTGYAAGKLGTIIKTTDGGNSWKTKYSLDGNFTSVSFPSPSKGFVAGAGGLIVKTTDWGENWMILNTNTKTNFNSLFFTNENYGFAVGDSGMIFQTKNGGISWVSQISGTSSHLYSVCFVNDETGWIVGANGMILHTIDGGKTWTIQMSGLVNTWHSVCFINEYVGYLAGLFGTVLKTTDGGANWINMANTGTQLPLTSIFFINESIGYAVGQYNTVINTLDGGSTWTNQNVGSGNPKFRSAFFTNENNGIIVGDAGIIYKTSNAGITWERRSFGPREVLTSVTFPDDTTGYAVGTNGTIIKTQDGGKTWINQISGTLKSLRSASFPTNKSGYVVGDYVILKTTNGGETWQKKEMGTNLGGFYSVCFVDSLNGYVGSENGAFLKTTDGGNSWINIPLGFKIYSIVFMDRDTGFIAGGTVIRKTINGGYQWNSPSLPPIYMDLQSLAFPTSTTGYAVCYLPGAPLLGGVLKTIDGGSTWKLQTTTYGGLHAVSFRDENNGYVFGRSGTIYQTTNGGEPGLGWIKEFSGTSSDLLASAVTKGNAIYTVGFDGAILKANSKIIPGIPDISLKSKRIYLFPNPAYNNITIWSSKGFNEETMISIYDMNGVQKIYKEFRNQNPIELNVSLLKQGIYFVKIETNDEVGIEKLLIRKTDQEQ